MRQIVWMIVAMLVDGVDGMLARWADVKTYANGIDGALYAVTDGGKIFRVKKK